MKATYYTVSDSRFFVGTVALLNSLRLTGNEGELVVLDRGLAEEQRRRLALHAHVVAMPVEESRYRALKPFARFLEPSGLVAVIDSDVIVTGSLDGLVRQASLGKICAFSAQQESRRHFPSWQEALRLSAPLRHETYVNASLVLFSAEDWPNLLTRWHEVCELVPVQRRSAYESWQVALANPLQFKEQDPLNALLMSEIPDGGVSAWEAELAPDPYDGGDVRVVDRQRLRCLNGGRETLLLHFIGNPKPWERGGWTARPFDALPACCRACCSRTTSHSASERTRCRSGSATGSRAVPLSPLSELLQTRLVGPSLIYPAR